MSSEMKTTTNVNTKQIQIKRTKYRTFKKQDKNGMILIMEIQDTLIKRQTKAHPWRFLVAAS